MSNGNVFWASPAWFIPVVLMASFAFIEGMHVNQHSKYCKTEAQWMNEKGMEYDRESLAD